MTTTIAVLGEFDPTREARLATNAALEHVRAKMGIDLRFGWIATDEITAETLAEADGILVAPGSPYRSMEKVLWAIQESRERHIPCLGTCGGFQHMVLEYARNVLKMSNAQHQEYVPDAPMPLLSRLECSLAGRYMDLRLAPDSLVARIYGATRVREKYFCSYGVNPRYSHVLEGCDLRVVGSDTEGVVRVVELRGHPFFIGTLYVPQVQSTIERPHPLVFAFVEAASKHAELAHTHGEARRG